MVDRKTGVEFNFKTPLAETKNVGVFYIKWRVGEGEGGVRSEEEGGRRHLGFSRVSLYILSNSKKGWKSHVKEPSFDIENKYTF